MSFGGEGGLRKVVLGGIHPLTQRYVARVTWYTYFFTFLVKNYMKIKASILLLLSTASVSAQPIENLYSKLVRINLCSSHWGAIGMLDLTRTRLAIMESMRKQIDDVTFSALTNYVNQDVNVVLSKQPYIQSESNSDRQSIVDSCQKLVLEFR